MNKIIKFIEKEFEKEIELKFIFLCLIFSIILILITAKTIIESI